MIQSAPYSFVSSVVIVCIAIGTVIYFLFKSRLDRQKETIEHQDRDIARLKESPVAADAIASTKAGVREPFINPRWEHVTEREFRNERVSVDGKMFHKCKFVNTSLLFQGTAPAEFIDCQIGEGTVMLETDNEAAKHYVQLCRMFGGSPGLEEIGVMVMDSNGKIAPISSGLKGVKQADPLSLQQRTLALAQRLRQFIEKHGARPMLVKADGESSADYLKRLIPQTQAWDDAVSGDYWGFLFSEIQQIRGELAQKGLDDSRINDNYRIARPKEENLRAIVEGLRFLASKLDH